MSMLIEDVHAAAKIGVDLKNLGAIKSIVEESIAEDQLSELKGSSMSDVLRRKRQLGRQGRLLSN